jgi:large subunit ribosomal protein L22
MVSKAQGRFLPVTPRKVRLVLRLVRGAEVLRAQAILSNLPKGACEPIAKVLKSAVANATRTGAWSAEQLFIARALADEGPMATRYRAGPMGRAMPFRKRFCHITIELDELTHGS